MLFPLLVAEIKKFRKTLNFDGDVTIISQNTRRVNFTPPALAAFAHHGNNLS